MAARKFAAFLVTVLQLCQCQNSPEVMPEFLAPLENHTVIQGRDVEFTCVVNHLQGYKVAWIKSDSRAILAIHTHLVAHNPRFSVTHNGHNTWKLHVTNVQKNDSGTYMCQVNTDPMLSQMGYMVINIPPDIMDDESSNGLIIMEGGNIQMKCVATGTPEPNVTWKRENGRPIVLRENGQKKLVLKHEGETLELNGVTRQEMGTYLCIASNGIPPSVSKRYSVQVNFQPAIKVTSQLVAAPIYSNVTVQCIVEASPQALNTWFRDNDGKLLPGEKYTMTDIPLNDYSWQMNLTIRVQGQDDFGTYTCASENAFGKSEGSVRLQELQLPLVPTTPPTVIQHNDIRPRKKVFKNSKNRKPKSRTYGEGLNEFDTDSDSDDEFGTTQSMGGSTQHGHRTERPFFMPSVSPPWIAVVNASSSNLLSTTITFLLVLLWMTAP